jgi:hypothetical protein
MARKGADNLLAAKERRKKKIAIVGAVLLVAVLAVQVPRTLEMLRPPTSSSPAEAQATDEETRTPATPLPTAAAPATDPVAAGAEVETGQLVSFTRFTRKDPFRPQIRDEGTAGGSSAAESGSTPAQSSKPARSKPQAQKPKRPRGTKAKKRPALVRGGARRVRVVATSAVISVNGASEQVDVGASFPKSQRLFRLASLGPYGAKIGVAGGSLAGGGDTVTLERGKPLTLENTASGERYRLRLVSAS